ncbi:unnamed protein product, partial [Vitis vinifera]|uniref:Uncharacterized protein n=1 Tax=Vitis vinifera TaxID=29760 RepID=D7SWI4_VITVI
MSRIFVGHLVMTRVRVPFLPKNDLLSQYSPLEDDFWGRFRAPLIP